MFRKIVSVFAFILLGLANAQKQPFSWSTCEFNGQNSAIINDLFITSPILHPGCLDVTIDGKSTVDIDSVVNATVDMWRTVSGLRSKVACTILTFDGVSTSIGTCTYPDLCDLTYSLLQVTPDNCPEYITEAGLNCKCPFDIPTGMEVYIKDKIEIIDLDELGVGWLVTGDFDIDVKATHRGKAFLCLKIKTSTDRNNKGAAPKECPETDGLKQIKFVPN